MKKLWIIICGIIILIMPFVAGMFAFAFNKNIYDNADFWYNYMAYFGTIVLAAVALWQNQTANEIKI